jgi:predicted amino acid dehydrogenase
MKRCAFIVHLRRIEDIAYVLPFPKFVVSKLLRRPLLWLFRNLRGRWGFMVRSRFRINDETEGFIVLMWMTGEQMIKENHWVKKRILDTVLYAQDKLRCKVIGLGALTASVTSAGKWLTERPEIKPDTIITHGDSYAVALTLEALENLARKRDVELSKSVVAIVGATGIIGEALSRALASKVAELILIGRRMNRLKELAAELRGNIKASTEITEAKRADIVVTATSWPGALISGEHLKENAVVYEVSQPRNVSKKITVERPDVLVVDGAYARVPENIKFWWMSLPEHSTFGCMAETIIETIANGAVVGHRVGRIDLEFVREISELGKRYGFTHAEFTSFNRKIPAEKFQ